MSNNEDIKEWAPVLIPTLCRYSLFRQLIESLENCVGACYTDVYVALDYPKNDSHREGWLKIKNYLANKSFKFNKFVVFEREYNYGLGRKGNFVQLRDDVLSKYNTYIITEDDNIFSKNFLLYINKGLQIFKDDETVISICGYRFFYNHKFSDNTYFRNQQDFNGWGYAGWVEKDKVIKSVDYKYFRSKLWDFNAIKKIWTAGPVLFSRFLAYTNEKTFKKADYFYGLYMILENKYQIMPRTSLVRNMGWDAEGENCNNYSRKIIENHLIQPIDDSDTFEFVGTGFEYFEENRKVMRDEDYNKNKVSKLKNLCKLILLQLRIIK